MALKDKTQQELAEMTDDEVEQLIRTELMENGVAEVEDPGDFELPPLRLKKTKYYEVGRVKFATSTQAEKFLALNPFGTEYFWNIGDDFRYADPVDKRIEVVELYDKEDLQAHGDDIIAWNTQHRRWASRKSDHDHYLRMKNDTASKVWNAVTKAREQAQKIQDVRNTFDEYMLLANGDDTVAMKFLVKTYGEELVNQAGLSYSPSETSSEDGLEVTA